MSVLETIAEKTEYRLVLVLSETRRILAINDVDGYCLPSISISKWNRPAKQLQEAIRSVWGLHVLFLDFFDGETLCAVAEVLVFDRFSEFTTISIEQVRVSELSECQRANITSILAGDFLASGPFSRIGWIDEALTWLESETGTRLSSKRHIEQYNAGKSSALVRFPGEDGRDYWLKATGPSNAHELSVTTVLSKLCKEYLPELIGFKREWNAWLMLGAGQRMAEVETASRRALAQLGDAVKCMAKLQMQTRGRDRELLGAGAFNQTLEILQKNADQMFDYIEEAMRLQISNKVPQLKKEQIQKLCVVFKKVCERALPLAICNTVVHGDMNPGNILIGRAHCQFIDWSESYLGYPLVTLQHLLLLNKVNNPVSHNFINRSLQQTYRDVWAGSYGADVLEEGLVYMPMVAIGSTLYGRGDWLNSPLRNNPTRQSHARCLARHMERSARELKLVEALCR
jgi:hypothetical protein